MHLNDAIAEMNPERNRNITCAVVTPFEGLYSETFIRDQIERLPCRVLQIHGTPGSSRFADKQICSPLLNLLASRTIRRIPERAVSWAETRIDRQLARFWRRHGVNVILAHFADAAVSIHESCRLAAVPLVVHCHGYDVYQTALIERLRARYTALFRYASAAIVGSTDMHQQLRILGAPEERIHFIPVGVDTDLFVPTDPGANGPMLLAVGRFVEKKAPYATLLAFSHALRACPDATLVMAGDGPLLDTCKQMSQALGLADRIQFLGAQSHAAVRELMRRARAFTQHSVRALNGDSEGTALSVLEAAACGLPVIATRHAGIKDSMIHGTTALLSDELDVLSMSTHMAMLLSNPELASELGRNARIRVANQYGMKQSVQRLADVLRDAAQRPLTFSAQPVHTSTATESIR
jgi:colanic acid/amylovoran biosynthesis glycosyltransferase